MAILQPTFSIAIASLRSSTDNPVAGPEYLSIERDMDIPADGLRIRLMKRSGVALDDEVTVELGHDGQNETVFTGKVAALRPAIAGIEILALGKLHALLNLRTASLYENQTIGQIANDLITQAGLAAGTVDDGPTLPTYAIDRRLSAFAHLKALADRLGYELYGDRQGNVMFHALGAAANLDALGGLGAVTGAVSSLTGGGEGYLFGQHLLAAAAQQQPSPWGTITVGGESPMSRQGDTKVHWLTTKDTDYQGVAGSGSPQLLLLDPAARTKDLADRFAAGYLARSDRATHTIQIRILGRPQVDLGDTISTSDVADDLINGSGYIRALRHRFSCDRGFVTELSIALGGAR